MWKIASIFLAILHCNWGINFEILESWASQNKRGLKKRGLQNLEGIFTPS